jgi:hypothetical protein
LQGVSSDKAIAERLLDSRGASQYNITVNGTSNVVGSNVNSTVGVPAGPIDSTTITDECSSLSSHDDEADEFYEESDEESDGMTPVPDLDDVFRTTYDSFQSDLKWHLPSGSTVEDLLYKAYWSKSVRPSVRNLIRSWIVDTGNEKMKALFSESDWAAIKAEVPPLPDVDPDFARSFLRFSKVCSLPFIRNRVAGKLIYHATRSKLLQIFERWWIPQDINLRMSHTTRIDILIWTGLNSSSVHCS